MVNRRGRGVSVLFSVCVAAAMTSCRGRDTGGGAGSSMTRVAALTADAATIVSTLKARPGSPLAASVAAGFDAVAGGLKPRFAASDVALERAPARLTLPALANAPLHLEDAATGLAVDVTLQGATSVAGQTTQGYVVYPGATATGGSIVHRAVAAGTEDFIAIDTKPAATQITYNVSLGAGAAALRLVSGTLEVLDAGGAPRLRVTPPYIVGSDGARTDATLAVAGCAVDSDPAPPWGRAVTAPGAATCQVTVTWPGSGVAYPALLDPRWTTTSSMGTARYEHTLTLIASNGKVLAAGGRSSTGSTTGLTTAELYDKTTGTWSATGSFTGARRLHTATQLPTSGNPTTSGKILIAGGISGTASLNTAQLYSPSAGTWSAAANLNAARHLHTDNLLPDGRVLVSGGMNGTTALQTAALYNPASGSGSWAATTGPIPPPGWRFGTATLIQTSNQQLNNHVLLVGGNNGTSTIASVFLFDPVQTAFSTLQALSSPREQHTASVLPNSNGKILVTGGKNGSTVLGTALIFDPGSSNGTWAAAGTMGFARFGHSATVLPTSIVANGTVLVAGGNNGTSTLSSAELFSGTSTWTSTPAIPGPMQNHGAVLLGNNMVLVAGGLSNSTTVLNAARLYDAAFGLGCSSGSQCPSGFCVNGICCDTACNGGCGACNLAGSLGTCTALSNGTSCRSSAGPCDVAEACNGSSLNCPSDAFAPTSTVCRSAADVCDLAENCPGNAAACPADAKKFNGTACTDDNNPCTTDLCNGTSNACQHAAGNAGTQCRIAAGDCDLAATCTGSSATCPANPFKPSSTVCRDIAGECDVAEHCTGSSANCPTDIKKSSGTACTDDNNVCTTDTCNGTSALCQHPAGNAGTQCRTATADCDLPATCTGSSTTCPANPFKPSSAVCRGVGGQCDVAENCTGSSAVCPTDTFAPSSTVCRASAGICDVAENCSGSSAACPADVFAPTSTVCRGTAGACDIAENCPGNAAACPADAFAAPSTICRAATGQCDAAENCTGASAGCPADVFASNGTSCDDGNNCTAPDTCTGGVCAGTPISTCQLNAPPTDRTIAIDFHAATSFLYSGSSPIQTGVAPGAVEFLRAAVIRGLVSDRSSAPLAGVTISIHGHPELGQTTTRADGMFDIAVNGGGLLNVDYSKSGFLAAQRQVNVPNRDYIWASDVVLVPIDPEVAIVNLSNATMQVAQGSVVTDVDGTRQGTLLVPEETTATMTIADGTSVPLSQMHVRLTEYTVGPLGPKAMPAILPPTSGYTYAVELSADEALAAGAKTVQFDRPLVNYLENFLGFPSGGTVPVGFYDRDKGAWIASDNGRVVKIVEIFGGMAELDTDGDETADDAPTLAALGITDNERVQLAGLYLPGQTLWRTPISHFSLYDCNWPIGPPANAKAPSQPPPKKRDKRKKDPCKKKGSIIQCENQVLGEAVPIVGTPFDLEYFSDRVQGFRTPNQISIPVTDSTAPPSVKRIEVEVQIAGRRITNEIPAAPNQSLDFEWDGKDAFGRSLQGAQAARIAVRYVYQGSYTEPETSERAFGLPSDLVILQDRNALEVVFDQVSNVSLGTWDTQSASGVGGWDLSIHHAYSPGARQMIRGSGEAVDGVDGREAITTVAGTGVHGMSPDGTQAKNAPIYPITAEVALGPDGSLYFPEWILDQGVVTGPYRIRRVSPAGILSTVAGGGTRSDGSSDDGVHTLAEGFPATEAQLYGYASPHIALGPDGSLYIMAISLVYDHGAAHLLHVEPDGTLRRVAGTWNGEGTNGAAGDGQPADQLKIGGVPFSVASDGSIVFFESSSIGGLLLRRISPDGIMTTIAGIDAQDSGTFTPDGVPAKGNPFLANAIALGPDGSIFFIGPAAPPSSSDYPRAIRRIGIDGLLSTVAGNGVGNLPCFAPFDGPALGFGGYMLSPFALAFGPDGSLYMPDYCGRWGVLPLNPIPPVGVIRRLTADGQLRTIAGGGPTPLDQMNSAPFQFFLDTDGSYGKAGDTTMARQWPIQPATDGEFPLLGSIAVSADSIYFIGRNGGNHFPSSAFIYRFSSGVPGLAIGLTQIPSEDGSEIYEFNEEGRHLRTLDALTGAVRYQFGYGSTGLLASVTNTDGLVTTIARDSSGTATAIVAPNGQTTNLAVGPDGYLAQVTNPAGAAMTFTYGSTGLLATHTDLRGGNHTFTFDDNGLLTRDLGPAGSSWDLARTESADSISVSMVTAEGRHETRTVTTSSFGTTRSITDASGLSATTSLDSAGNATWVDADGTRTTTKEVSDPRFGTAVPYVTTSSIRTPGGVLAQAQVQRSVTPATGGGFSLQRTMTYNGDTSNFVYDADSRQSTVTTPAGRQMTLSHDDHGRVVGLQRSGLAPISMVYNSHGRLSSLTAGTGTDARTTTWDYDALDRLVRGTDPSGQMVTFGSDNANRITSAELPGGASIAFAYDAATDLMSITPPDRSPHIFQRTLLGSESGYTPPAADSPPASAQYSYDLDNQLTQMQRLDGTTLLFNRDSGGRISSIAGPQGSVTFNYGPGGHVAGIASSNGVSLTVTRDGFLPTGDSWSGPVTGAVTRTFDSNFRVASISISGSVLASYAYDSDGLMLQAGSLTTVRDTQSGSPLTAVHGVVSHTYAYNAFGERVSTIVVVGSQTSFTDSSPRDLLGRVVTRDQTVLGNHHVFEYHYDNRRRLIAVDREGLSTASYSYDANGNRLTRTIGSSTSIATYDDRDRQITDGSLQFSYNRNGELVSKHDTATGAQTSYAYDDQGHLKRVTLPSGSVIDYVLDGIGHRMQRAKDGTPVQGLLYDGTLRVIAELDGANQIVSRFVYGLRANVPEYLVRNGLEYRIVADHLGSPRLVIDVSSGVIVQQLDYDEFGNVTLDTNPGFQPFAFAGGILDRETGLVHFGSREYDPAEGRWTTADHIRFAGGDTNLFAYVGNDPINFIDPTGFLQVSPDLQADFPNAAEAIATILDRVGRTEIANLSLYGHATSDDFVKEVLDRKSKWCVGTYVSNPDPNSDDHECGQEAVTPEQIDIERHVLSDFENGRISQHQFDATLLHEVAHLLNDIEKWDEKWLEAGYAFERATYGDIVSCRPVPK